MTSVRRAADQGWPAVEGLLKANGLRLAGARHPQDIYLVAVKNEQIVATAGLEVHGDAGLLRSVAVLADSEEFRGACPASAAFMALALPERA